ncbi:MAG: FAD-dependent oxidoreductase, partial [Clostridiales bacterium]
LLESNSQLKICLLEKGSPLKERSCPMVAKKAANCLMCKNCAIMEGLAGAGAFSDGKYVISTEYGGWLTEFLPPQTVLNYIEKADGILQKFGATAERFMPNDDLKKLCLEHDLHMNQAQLKHLGTDANYATMAKLIDSLENKLEIMTNTEVLDVDKENHQIQYRHNQKEDFLLADKIIFAVGRVGSSFFAKWCNKNKITMTNNQIDIGVRVELPALIWDNFSKKIYEPKIWFRSQPYNDITRMFCFNERGNVVIENTNGILTVNGHSYKDQARKTENSNFALLTTIRFTQPFKAPIDYARRVASLANMISGGSVLVQRLGDLINGRRTDETRLEQSTVRPTLQAAIPGDLSLCMPKRQLDNIIGTLYALDKVAPGTANYDTLLYGVECKYYSARPQCHDFMIEGCQDIYAIGDGAGFTRSLSQAAAHGLYLADHLMD